jgi:histidine ammonia-lyase
MILLDGTGLTLEQFGTLARGQESCALAPSAREKVEKARGVIERALGRGEAVYGVNTGFGHLAKRRIPHEQTQELQSKLLLSHAAGMGEPLPREVVRGMLVLRVNALAHGHSGVRVELLELMLAFLDRDLLPVVPSRGSVGASGDLAPLSHLALPVIGAGRVSLDGEEMAAAAALERSGLAPLTLEAKEGLALINGTQAMTSLLALASLEARRLVRIADLVGALSLDAIRGSDGPFDPRIHALRPFPGQRDSAANLRALLVGSEIREEHRFGDDRVQDPYSFRCMPQVHGAARDVLADVEAKLAIEMNAVTDNPLVFAEDDAILSGGNFHGEAMAMAADFLAIALCEIGAISERRTEKLNQSDFSGLPDFLVEDAGMHSGFMIAHVAAAALAAENKVLAHPASVDSIPTSADKEDFVSMGMGAALKLGEVVANVRRILAVELAAAAQGVDFRRPLRSSANLEALHAAFRQRVHHWREVHPMADDLAAAEEFLVDEIEGHLAELR